MIEFLIEGIIPSSELEGLGSEIPFNRGDIVGYASMVLAQAGESARERIIPALCLAMKTANPVQSLDLTRSLLDLILSHRKYAAENESPLSLDALESEALLTIANHGAWKVEKALFVNYSNLLRSYGLPYSREELIKFVKKFASRYWFSLKTD